jgi:hypothetical protein
MNCCVGIPAKYAPVDALEKPVSSKLSDRTGEPADVRAGFPAITKRAEVETNFKRQFYSGKALVRSGGNALMEYNEKTMSDLVRVTVPGLCWQNQVIQVIAPDGERSAYVRIPLGCTPGSTFLVNIPHDQRVNDLQMVKEEYTSQSQSQEIEVALASQNLEELRIEAEKAERDATSADDHAKGLALQFEDIRAEAERANANANEKKNAKSKKKMGLLRGGKDKKEQKRELESALQYSSQKNDEANRAHSDLRNVKANASKLMAEAQQKRANAYEMKLTEEVTTVYPPIPAQLQEREVARASQNDDDDKKEKSMMLVNKPPDVSPGTMIYVQTPGNQGRVLPVIVPEGSEPQFYVEYNNNIEDVQENNGRENTIQTVHNSQAATVLPALT